MAYTAVPIVATGDLWTASNHNTYIRDNFAAGVPDIFTTKGDLAVASAADTAGRLGVGTTGQILVADSAQSLGIKWDGAVAAHCTMNTSQSLSNSTETILNFDSKTFDSHGCVTTGSSWKFTAPVAGYYFVSAMLQFASTSNWLGEELAYMKLFKSGGGIRFLDRKEAHNYAEPSTRPLVMTLTGGALVEISAGEYIDLRGYQNSGAALSLTPFDGNYISIFKVR